MNSAPDEELAARLGTFVQDWRCARALDTPGMLADRLTAFLAQARPLLSSRPAVQVRPPLDAARLSRIVAELAPPLRAARTVGEAINPWAVAGLKSLEVRNAAVLAALWSPVQAGDVGILFLGAFFSRLTSGDRSLPTTEELAQGYHVRVEHCPDGDGCDRVDLVIETTHHVVGIEIKINAGLGPDQLLRYMNAIGQMADRRRPGKRPIVILLAPFGPDHPDVVAATWATIRAAAHAILPRRTADYSFTEYLIATFARHAARF